MDVAYDNGTEYAGLVLASPSFAGENELAVDCRCRWVPTLQPPIVCACVRVSCHNALSAGKNTAKWKSCRLRLLLHQQLTGSWQTEFLFGGARREAAYALTDAESRHRRSDWEPLERTAYTHAVHSLWDEPEDDQVIVLFLERQ